MKMKKMAILLTALALGAFAAHAGAAERYSSEFETIKAAFDAMQDGDTLVLSKDSELNAQVDIHNKKSITLDLNGYTLTLNVTGIYPIQIREDCELTVKDGTGTNGKIVSNSPRNISLNAGTFTLESGMIKAENVRSVALLATSETDYPELRPAIININGGMIEAGVAVAPSLFCEFNMSGGVIKGTSKAMQIGGTKDFYENKITITGGTIEGKVDVKVIEEKPNIINVTGGTFTDASFVNEYVASDLIRNLGDGSYAVGKDVSATIETKNVSQQTIGETAATGFLTTISSDEAFDLKTIKWAVTYDGTTKSTGEYKLGGTVTVGGDATVGLVVDGFADAGAEASATVNGYIK